MHQRDTVSSVTFVGVLVLIWFTRDPLLGLLYDTSLVDQTIHAKIRLLTLIFGVVVSASIAVAVYLQLTLNTKAHHLAEEMMSDLILSREQFRLLYDNSPIPYFLLDERGFIHNPNKAALRFFGATQDKLEEVEFFDHIIKDEKMERSFPILQSKVERGIPVSREEMQVTPVHGDPRWVLTSIFAVDRQAPLAHKRLVSMIDITEAKEIDRVKTDFVSLASHQLRTPLTAVKWYIDLLLTSNTIEVSDVVRDYLQKIYVGNQRMVDLVSTLLNVSRIEMGTVPIEVGTFTLEEVARDVLDEVSKIAAEKQIPVHTQFENILPVQSDKNLVRIAVQNLLTNALRYTPNEGHVSVSATCTSDTCSLSVEDSGCGIPPEAYDKLFSKMYRADNAKKIEAKGTGLGLYMTKAFVEKLGGSIDFTSVLGKGTTFTIHIPTTIP